MGTAVMAPNPFVARRPDDMTLDEFLKLRIRQVIDEEMRSREDVLSS